MRINTLCFECMHSQSKTTLMIEKVTHFEIDQEWNSDGFFNSTCPKGHKFYTQIQGSRFQILFETGCRAFIKKYFIETVGSLSASVERSYEFIIKFLMIKKGINPDNISSNLNKIFSRSEKELGAFIALYFAEYKELPSILDSKMIKFRNKVLHKAYYPTEIEVLKYANNIYQAIHKNMAFLKKEEKFHQYFAELIFNKVNKERYHVTTISIPLMLDFVSESEFSFESKLKNLENDEWMYKESKIFSPGL